MSIATILLGVGTNKIIAVHGGTEAIALLGLYRTLTAFVIGAVLLGLPDVVVRALSKVGPRHRLLPHFRSISWLLGLQFAAVLVIAGGLGGPISSLLFGARAEEHVLEVRLVLVLSAGAVALQMSNATLGGLLLVRASALIGLATSALTIVTTYPFLLMGSIGLAFVIGATCFVGAALGFWASAQHAKVPVSVFLPSLRPRDLGTLRPALALAVQPYVVTLSTLAILTMVGRQYGLGGLGAFNAASTLEVTGIMVVMGAMRSYVLPTLSTLPDEEARAHFLRRVLHVLLSLVTIGVAFMICSAPVLISVLFSGDFDAAIELTAILGLSMIGQVYVWCGAMMLIHRGAFGTFLAIDAAWAVIRIVATAAVVRWEGSLAHAAWSHVLAYTVSACFYARAISPPVGTSPIGLIEVALGGASMCGLYGLWVLIRSGQMMGGVVMALAIGGLAALCGWRALRRLRT